jgi:hypothetical protein
MTARNARIRTARADRYAKQLASHLGRRHGGEWSQHDRTGWIRFPSGRVDLQATDDLLTFDLEALPEAVDELEDVVSRHLLRFADEPLDIRWTDLENPRS